MYQKLLACRLHYTGLSTKLAPVTQCLFHFKFTDSRKSRAAPGISAVDQVTSTLVNWSTHVEQIRGIHTHTHQKYTFASTKQNYPAGPQNDFSDFLQSRFTIPLQYAVDSPFAIGQHSTLITPDTGENQSTETHYNPRPLMNITGHSHRRPLL